MRTILITGGSGFIGSHIAQLHQGKAQVRVLDNFSTGYRANLNGLNCEIIEGDIMDRASLRKAVKGVDSIFHLAAKVSVPESMKDPVAYMQANSVGTANVLEEAANAGVRKLVLSTSSAVYGDAPEQPKEESMRPAPISPYALGKYDGEILCDIYSKMGRIKTACLRYFNVFGPRQDPKSAYAAAIPIFISKAIKGEDIPIFGDGTQTRDFVYVKEVAAANAFMAEHDFQGVYNVGYGKTTEVGLLAKRIVAMLNSKSKILNLAERPGDIKHSGACVAKLLSTGYKHCSNFDAGLGDTIAYYSAVLR